MTYVTGFAETFERFRKSKGQTMIDKENLRLNSKTPLKTGDMNLGAPFP
jgi:hypothetical protein